MARSDNGDDGLWKEIGEEVHKDADKLFKVIGEAYAILSDPTKVSLVISALFVYYAFPFCGTEILECCASY